MRGLQRWMLAPLAAAALSLSGGAGALAQPAPQPAPPPVVNPGVGVDPDEPDATPHWTITIAAGYCGGYRVGDGVYLSPEPPLVMPSSVPDGSVLFAGLPASVDWVDGVMRVNAGPGVAFSMICMAGDRPLNIEFMPEAGFSLPDTAGDYAIDVWTGVNPNPLALLVSVPTDADQPASSN